MHFRHALYPVVVVCLVLGPLVHAGIVVPAVSEAPVLDGKGTEAAWSEAPSVVMNHAMRRLGPLRDARVKMCRTDEALFVLFECDEPSPGSDHDFPLTRDGQLWWLDSVILLLAPDAAFPEECYKILIAQRGGIWDCWYGPRQDIAWDGDIAFGVYTYDGGWNVEMSVSLASLSRSPITTDHWSGNFGRICHQGLRPTTISWQKTLGTWRETERFAAFDLPGVSEVAAVRQTAAGIADKAAQCAQAKIDAWQDVLDADPTSAYGAKVKARLEELDASLQGTGDAREMWAAVREVNNDMPFRAPAAQLAEQQAGAFGVYEVSPMVKTLTKDFPSGERSERVELDAARGEAESTQLVLVSPEGVTGLTAAVSALRGPRGSAIQPEIRLVKYVPVHEPMVGGDGRPGMWPDPLFSMRPFDVKPEQSQAVWITVWVPREAQSGVYEGQVTFAGPGNQSVEIPMTLRVYDATLPVLSELQVYMRSAPIPAWQDLLLKNRQCPMPPLPWKGVFAQADDGTITATWDEFDRTVEAYKAKGATIFRIEEVMLGGRGIPPVEKREHHAQKLRLTNEHLTAQGWADDFLFYLFDEPAPHAVEGLRELCDFIHQHGPDLQVMLTYFHPEMLNLTGSIDIWSPQSFMMYPHFNKVRQSKGEKIWPYVCIGNTGLLYPDCWKIDVTGVSHRAFGAWLWKYQVDGFLYWATSYWKGGEAVKNFQTTVSFPFGNGDGYTFYPSDGESDEPVPSIRLELTRDAIEDFDLLALLKQAAARVEKRGDACGELSWLTQARTLLDTSTLIRSMEIFDRAPQAYEEHHRRVLQALADEPR